MSIDNKSIIFIKENSKIINEGHFIDDDYDDDDDDDDGDEKNNVNNDNKENLLIMEDNMKMDCDCDNIIENEIQIPSETDKDDDSNSDVPGYENNRTEDITKELARIDDDIRNSTAKNHLMESSQQNRMRVALGVLVRLILPLCNRVARGWQGIRGVRLLKALKNLGASRQMLTNMLAYAANTISMGLSSVQVSHRIDPILKIMKLKKGSTVKSIAAHSSNNTTESNRTIMYSSGENFLIKTEEIPEKCVTLNVLAEPPPGTPIRADIILIHGLHGSLVNTWKQGQWNSEGRQVKFQRPPRPPLRPPKRPKHTRTSRIIPPHSRKRPRYTNVENFFDYQDSDCCYDSDAPIEKSNKNYTYKCGDPNIIGNCDGIEYSFPTFRLRMEDRSVHDEKLSIELKNRKYNKKSSIISISSSSSSSSTTTAKISSKTSSTLDNCDIEEEEHEDQQQQQQQQQQEEDKYSKCWPGDWLPLDCPGVRVIALNYTTDPYLWRPVWIRKRHRTNLRDRTREMTDLLIEKKVGYGHPIIWVGHSKGGIFIKQIIVDAWESGKPSVAPLWQFSRGVFFYSVPHRGSPLADFNLPFLRQSIELTEIQKNCPSILDLHRRFVALYHSGHLKIDVFSFVETALTLMSVLYLRIVGIDSADPGIGEVCGVQLDHREICKPRSRKCILYTELAKMINRVS